MDVFLSAALGSDDESVLIAPARAVTVRTLAISETPRSLCQIQADEDDYEWVCEWARRLTPQHLQRWLFGFRSRMVALQEGIVSLSYAEAAGCLLLLLASESARREASEGNLWPTVRRRFSDSARRLLFDAQGQPKREFKDALEGAARKLSLRHIFGVAGTHNYYISVYLQFGFTRKGMERLPHWLAGQPASEAVSHLLGYAEDPGGSCRSDSFASLWDILRSYRRNNVTEANTRRTLSRSPWVLPDWLDDLIEQAVQSRQIPDRELGDDSFEPLPPTFLAETKLQWDLPANPVFTTEVVNLADFDLTSDRYQVIMGNDRLATLLRNEGGHYTATSERVTLPSETADFTVALGDDNGTVVGNQLLQLWDPDEDVELFDLATGNRLNAYDALRSPNKDYGLLVSTDLRVEPLGLQFDTVGTGDHAKRLYLLQAGENRTVRVTLPGTGGEASEFWNSEINGGLRAKPSEPGWAVLVDTSIFPQGPEYLGRRRSIRITVPDSHIAVQYVRVGGMPLDCAPGGDRVYRTDEFDIFRSISAAGPHRIKVKLGLRRGTERTTVERDCFANAYGVMRASGDGWEVVNPQEKLSKNDTSRYTYRLVMAGTETQVSDLALMEGSVFLRRAWSRPQGLGELGGYGAPLEIRAPYNPFDDGNSLVIASEVRNTGILANAAKGEAGELCLRFRDPLEPGRGHEIVLWPIGALPLTCRAVDVVIHQGAEWRLPGVEYPGEHCCVAVSYAGVLIGSSWPDRVVNINVDDEDSALTTAAMLRWLHAPIVAPGWLEASRSFAHRYPAQVLAAWLGEEGLHDGLFHGVGSNEQWGAAVRRTFAGWNPDLEVAEEIINTLAKGHSDEDVVLESLLLLLRESPLLMGRVARAWLASASGPDRRQSGRVKRDLIARLRFLIADVPEESVRPFLMELWHQGELEEEPQPDPLSDFEKQQSEQDKRRELLDDSASAMGVDPGHVASVIEKVLGPLDYEALEYLDQNNAETALNVRPFREVLGLRILASLNNGV